MDNLLIGKKAKPTKSVGTDRTAKTIRNKRKKSDAVVYADKLAKTVEKIESKIKVRVFTDRNGLKYPVPTFLFVNGNEVRTKAIKARMIPPYKISENK